jgi:tetratricopeptide (TPR) repeat protein
MLERLSLEGHLWAELATHYGTALESVLDRDAAIDLHRRRARVLLENLDRPWDAIEHYWQLIQIDPSDIHTRAKLSELYAKTGRWNDLIMLLERELPSAEIERKRAILLEIARIWLEKLNNAYEAQEAFEKVLSEFPGDPGAQAGLEHLRNPCAGSLDDSALAELGLLEGADEHPIASSPVPPDHFADGSVDAPPVSEGTEEAARSASAVFIDSPSERPDATSELDVDDVEEVDVDMDDEPEMHVAPNGVMLKARADADSTSEIDFDEVEEIIDSVEEDLPPEAGPEGRKPPPLPSRPPPPPLKK